MEEGEEQEEREDLMWINWDEDHECADDHRVYINELPPTAGIKVDGYLPRLGRKASGSLARQSSSGSVVSEGGVSSRPSAMNLRSFSLPGSAMVEGTREDALPPLPPEPWKSLHELQFTPLRGETVHFLTAVLVVKPQDGQNVVQRVYGAFQRVFMLGESPAPATRMVGRPLSDFLRSPFPDGEEPLYFPYSMVVSAAQLLPQDAMRYSMLTEIVVVCQDEFDGAEYMGGMHIINAATPAVETADSLSIKVIAKIDIAKSSLSAETMRREAQRVRGERRVVESRASTASLLTFGEGGRRPESRQ